MGLAFLPRLLFSLCSFTPSFPPTLTGSSFLKQIFGEFYILLNLLHLFKNGSIPCVFRHDCQWSTRWTHRYGGKTRRYICSKNIAGFPFVARPPFLCFFIAWLSYFNQQLASCTYVMLKNRQAYLIYISVHMKPPDQYLWRTFSIHQWLTQVPKSARL